MKAAGLLTDAVLTIPAWDVDYVTAEPQVPERDRVTVNGHVVPGEYLRGKTHEWHLNTYTIPIEWLNFPENPLPGMSPIPMNNSIVIDVDTEDTGVWCTSIPWVSLEFQATRPTVLVHGMRSSGDVWEEPGGIWVSQLEARGIPNSNTLSMSLSGNLADTFKGNARKIASEISASKARWGVDKVNLVCHSKGGLDARWYVRDAGGARYSSVEQVIQIGTPNGGAPLADALLNWSAIFSQNLWLGLNLMAGPGGGQLRTKPMMTYNRIMRPSPGVGYTTLAGNYIPSCPPLCAEAALEKVTKRPGDTVVPEWSAYTLPGAETRTEGGGTDLSTMHTNQPQSQTIFNNLLDRVGDVSLQQARVEESTPGQRLATFGGFVSEHDTLNAGTVNIDESVPTYFSVFRPEGELYILLVSPSGAKFDVTTPGAYWDENDLFGTPFGVLVVPSPEVGVWTVKVTAFNLPGSADSTAYMVTVLSEGTAVTLDARVSNSPVSVGQSLTYRASVQRNGAPVLSATVTAHVQGPDSLRYEVAMVDDGSQAGSIAGDGIYAGTFSSVTLPGHYPAVIVAAKAALPGNPAFSRETSAFETAAASTSQILGTSSDHGEDVNGNAQYDSLVVEANLAISTSGRYMLVGTLIDSQGNRETAWGEDSLLAGTRSLRLAFGGPRLFGNRINGPYTVGELCLAEISGDDIRLVDEFGGTLTTSAYGYSQFEHGSLVRLTGVNSDAGVDVDGFSLFELLRVNIGLEVDSTATYSWSANLTDSIGLEVISFATGQAQLMAGTDTLVIDFPGSPIGARGIDGPYRVRDLMVYAGSSTSSFRDADTTTAYSAFAFEGSIPADKRLYITGTFAYDDSLLGNDAHIGCNLIVAYDTKDQCAGCDSTALDPLAMARLEWTPDGRFIIGPVRNEDTNDDGGPLDIIVRVYYKNSEGCWQQSLSIKWFLAMVDSAGQTWHYDSPLTYNVTGDTLDVGLLKPTSYAHRSALHIYKTLVETAWGRAHSNGIYPDSITVVWSPGYSKNAVGSGTYYDAAQRDLYVDGRDDETPYAPDEWDDPVLIREYGHVVAQELGVYANVSGASSPCLPPVADSLAWNEGFASYFAMDALDFWGFDPVYVDRGGGGSQFSIDFETGCVTPACPNGCPNSAGPGNEIAVAGALWDLFDDIKDNQGGNAFGDSVAEASSRFETILKSTRPHIRTIRAFRDAYIAAYAPQAVNPNLNWLIRQVFWEHGIDETFTGAEEFGAVPAVLSLYPSKPNPFNPSTLISFDLPGSAKSRVKLTVFNVRGQRVRSLVNGDLPPGRHEAAWNGRNDWGEGTSSGVYFCRLETIFGDRSIKVVLAR